MEITESKPEQRELKLLGGSHILKLQSGRKKRHIKLKKIIENSDGDTVFFPP